MGPPRVTKAVVTVAADAARVHESEAIARRKAVKFLLVVIVKIPECWNLSASLLPANGAC
jgi:hypothetical protein